LASVSNLHVDHPDNRALLPELVAEIHEGGADAVMMSSDTSGCTGWSFDVRRAFVGP